MRRRPMRFNGVCHRCGYKMGGSSDVIDGTQSSPENGDVSICLVCGELALFVVDRRRREITLRPLTPQEYERAMKDDFTVRLLLAHRSVVEEWKAAGRPWFPDVLG